MSEKIKQSKTLAQRSSEAVERRKNAGLKAHEAHPGSRQARIQEVQKNFGILDGDNRYPKTVKYERARKHDTIDTNWRKRLLVGSVATVASLGAGAAIGAITPDNAVVPHPGNMEQFSNDPLQDSYNQNPDGFDIEGSQIVPKGYDNINGVLLPEQVVVNGQINEPSSNLSQVNPKQP